MPKRSPAEDAEPADAAGPARASDAPSAAREQQAAPDATARQTVGVAPPDRRALRRGLFVAVAIGIAFAVGIGVTTVDARTIEAARRARFAIALAAAMVGTAWLAEGTVFCALTGWKRPRDVLRGARVYLAGSFPSAVTPFAAGAIPAWTWLLTLEGLGAGEAAAVVGARALVTGVFFALAGVGALALAPRYLPSDWHAGFAWGVAVLALVAIGLAYLAVRPDRLHALAGRLARNRALVRWLGQARMERFGSRMAEEGAAFSQALRRFGSRPWALAGALGATVVSRTLLYGVAPVLLVGMGWRGDVGPVLLAALVVGVVGSSSPTPGGSGAAEAVLAALISGSVPRFMLGAAVVIWRLLTFYAEATVGGVLFAVAVRRASDRGLAGRAGG